LTVLALGFSVTQDHGNLKIARRVAFAISLCALLGMFIVGLLSWM